MGKRGKSHQKKGPKDSKKIKVRGEDAGLHMDDEIDTFHKKKDMIPLDINADTESDADDDMQPVFDYKGIDSEDEDEDEDDEDENEDDDDDDSNLRGLAAKIARQQKYLREKFGGLDDDMHDESEEEEEKGTLWSKGKGKDKYYGSEIKSYELQSSDEDMPAEEEEEVIKLQKERAEFLREEDFGLQNVDLDDSDEEPTLEEMMDKSQTSSKFSQAEDDSAPMYEEVKKDLNALSRDEQMDVVQSSAPELVGLLAELNEAMIQLETQVNPLLSKVDNSKKEGMHYLEVKRVLLLAYIQAITFYLLLKSEGQPVRDHPVIARLVEIKSLLDKMKELDGYLPNGLEDILNENGDTEPANELPAKNPAMTSVLCAELNALAGIPSKKQFDETDESVKKPSTEVKEKKQRRDKHKEDPVSLESAKMLQYRAALEEKLKLKTVSGSVEPKTDRNKKQKLKKLTGKLETIDDFDDFDDDAMDLEGTAHNVSLTSKVSKLITARNKVPKGISGDDDLPGRDDLGERRWKHELRVLAGAGIRSAEDIDLPEKKLDSDGPDVEGSGETDESEDDFYNQVKQERAAKQAMKAGKYSRSQEFFEPETAIDGKRHISTQMEKNRGLTRPRKKLIKNPRKKYKLKYGNVMKRRKGQVRDIKKPSGPYAGEETGINARISRSVRFKG